MAKFRNIYCSFWTDAKMVENFTPEDRYFYLYLMSNPHTSLCGCYEISVTQMANELGYQKDCIDKLITRFMEVHDVIRYDYETKEVIILNWYKYNWHGSEKTIVGVEKGIAEVKNPIFKMYLENIVSGNTEVSIGYTRDIVDESIPHTRGRYVTFTFIYNNTSISLSNTNDLPIDEYKENIIEILNYFNRVSGKKYKYTSKVNQSHIRARLKEGFTVEDFKKVIDIKNAEWKDDAKMCQYIRPETLFGTRFESYLNQKVPEKKGDWYK